MILMNVTGFKIHIFVTVHCDNMGKKSENIMDVNGKYITFQKNGYESINILK